MNKIDGVIFDWAGTVVDFGCFAPVNVFIKIFKAAGVEVTVDEARVPMGMLKRDHIKAMLEMPRINRAWEEQYDRYFNEKDIDELYSSFESLLLASLAEYTNPLPDVVETVKKLRDQGLKIGSTTGYTDSMMKIVTMGAKEKGYEPDFWITPDSTNCHGRPYPYMIFRNMEALKLSAPWKVIKIGDTAADIKEGLNAGVWSVGVIVGSSQMGLNYDEFESLSEIEKKQAIKNTKQAFCGYGADFTIVTMKELPQLIARINTLLERGKRPNVKSD
ncbi:MULTISPECIES: phosphonoacetaldehyde hydrolase [Pelosinus]|uniref:Phosphonoacetaldehyde hydrolase n=1 Tax=Pelosinus fermentans B4 TaxID=1149862 RepID=I9LEL9_9FIRM|nr:MULTISPECIES: phosphonoacetaldehyde hydrolase [Pelosinus]EIW18899.1 phosphonoacetaldehyde hydrolase [Pelosinus fermentans B4]EIW21890.1 Phosphonoacetaldehyde hydrolase [Pelosinus fermentans A11]OAM95259.1 Phosphonoacetaldehyde hydrolase [Pelosinus fermentans DSM 17108]SDR25505.1 phosphonoacetaldehyde hydrolase [Pelosinus fermentans]